MVILLCSCQSKDEYNGEVAYEKSGDVALNLPYTATVTVEPSVPSQHNDEVVIEVSTNGGTHPELINNTSKVRDNNIIVLIFSCVLHSLKLFIHSTA